MSRANLIYNVVMGVINRSEVLRAHQHSFKSRDEIIHSALCGCFYCLRTFSPVQIVEWIDVARGDEGQTALCPYCGIDSVIGDKSGFPITDEFLAEMKAFWFNGQKPQRIRKEFFKPLYNKKK